MIKGDSSKSFLGSESAIGVWVGIAVAVALVAVIIYAVLKKRDQPLKREGSFITRTAKPVRWAKIPRLH